ncbi:MAG: response regulator [Proteobacteria bacterium]|nr:response regulator [Pseudomonadota bacterium]
MIKENYLKIKELMEKKQYCEQCKENVLTYSVIRNGKEEICCLYCGLPIAVSDKKFVEDSQESSGDRVIFYADDSAFMRELVKDIFANNSITKNFITFENGELLLEEYTRFLIEKKNVSLVILDIKMPYISGISVGIAMRAMERAFGAKPAPILFFSVKQADEELQKFFNHSAPAYYLNKGASTDIEDLEKRMLIALESILK